MNKQKPLVSVIMPVYNAGEFLVEAIESILNQTYRYLELIIVDDASIDNSWNIISRYAKLYPKIVTAVQTTKQTNSAGNGAMNFGFTFAKGELIARMDADDIALPTRIEKQVKYMLAHPDVILLGTNAYVVDKSGKRIGKKVMPMTHSAIYRQYGVFHPIVHPSVMLRRSLLPRQDRIYEMKFDVNDDYFTFFKLLNYGKFANLPQLLMKYRVHGKNWSLNKPKTKFIDSVRIRITAMRRLNYHMPLTSLFLMLLQILVVLPIPERFIVPLYLFTRGILQPEFRFKLSLPDFLKNRSTLIRKTYYTVRA